MSVNNRELGTFPTWYLLGEVINGPVPSPRYSLASQLWKAYESLLSTELRYRGWMKNSAGRWHKVFGRTP